jgi:hypothetical protein
MKIQAAPQEKELIGFLEGGLKLRPELAGRPAYEEIYFSGLVISFNTLKWDLTSRPLTTY